MTRERIRIAAVSDLHCTRTSEGAFQPLFNQVGSLADVLLLCGDLTDHGLPDEAKVFARELANVRIPMIGVMGNHDYHSGHAAEVEHILEATGLKILDGDDCVVEGIGFAGVKGFGGGFGRHTLEAWGEDAIKKFVYEAVEESLKLEKALARLGTSQRVAVLHYAPIQATVEGEPPAIFPFLGSSRLEEPVNRYGVSVVFHGHAHHGSPEGKTLAGIPVYNVSISLMCQAMGDQPPLRIVELPVQNDGNGVEDVVTAVRHAVPAGH